MGYCLTFQFSAAGTLAYTFPVDTTLNAVSKTSTATGAVLTTDPDDTLANYTAPSVSQLNLNPIYVFAATQLNNTGLKIFIPSGTKAYMVVGAATTICLLLENSAETAS